MNKRLYIENLINKYKEKNDFTGEISEEKIKSTEEALMVSFSDDYKWFIKNYGSGGVLGIDILGIAKNNISTVKNSTQKLREAFNLESNFYVIEDCDEFFYCGKSKEEKIYYWDRDGGVGQVESENFLNFLQDRISGAAEDFN